LFELPVFWNISEQLGKNHPNLLTVLKMNPIYYLIKWVPEYLFRRAMVFPSPEIHAVFLGFHIIALDYRNCLAYEIQGQVC
jgi:ABC-type polysaccharide/polyol phosphate export permease